MTQRLQASLWPQATEAFRADDRWVGGDDAYSIDLQDGRRLWLFGDTFIAAEPGGDRADADFIHNSVAIQHGHDLASNPLRFQWRTDESGRPTSFFADLPDGDYLWPGHGAMVEGTLVLFFMRVRDTGWVRTSPDQIETLEFFQTYDWSALRVTDISGDPADWELEPLARPSFSFTPMVGSAGVIAHDDYLYAHGVDYPTTYVCRWTTAAVTAGNLLEPEWWCGDDDGWVPTRLLADRTPAVTLTDGEPEFTVHEDERSGEFHLIFMTGLDTPRFEVRTAPHPHGPWSAPRVVEYRPADGFMDDRFCYAGKAHPDMAGGGLILTHNAIPHTLQGIRDMPDLYWPRVVRLTGL